MAEIIHERFKLIKKCGSGGTGEVYQARDQRLKRLVAIKRVSVSGRTRRDMLRRLLQEAEYLARVEHANVVDVYDILESETSVSIVMELVRGTPFLDHFRKKALPEDEFLGFFRQLVAALEAVHGVGLIHRDVNPRNVLVSREGVIKLTDFGLSVPVSDDKPRAGGTLGYMAPETLRTHSRVTFAVDIYSLGFMAYQALLGIPRFKKLYATTKPRDWVRWVLSKERFRELSELDVDVSPGLSKLIARMLEKDLDQRYRKITQVRQDLEELLTASHKSVVARPGRPPSAPPDLRAAAE
ncbi:MAG: serine/threonine-protein kinase [Planctomycetota bacterium]|nr:serine/threonine-protein kinase [Planctomycetota bacterium]